MPKIYSVYTGVEDEGTGFYTTSKRRAIRHARLLSRQLDLDVDVGVDTIPRPSVKLILAILNGEGWSRSFETVATIKPPE